MAVAECVHRKADEGGIPGRMSTEENAARCVLRRRQVVSELGDTPLDPNEVPLHGGQTITEHPQHVGVGACGKTHFTGDRFARSSVLAVDHPGTVNTQHRA